MGYHGFTKKAHAQRWQAWQADAENMAPIDWLVYMAERVTWTKRSATGVDLNTDSEKRQEWAHNLRITALGAMMEIQDTAQAMPSW